MMHNLGKIIKKGRGEARGEEGEERGGKRKKKEVRGRENLGGEREKNCIE